MSILLNHNTGGYSPYPHIFLQTIYQLIDSKKGCQVNRGSGTFTFEYRFKIDEYESKNVCLAFEERKNSYKVTIIATVPANSIPGGLESLLKIIQKLNSEVPNDITSFSFSEPNVFSSRLIIEKQAILLVESSVRKTYCQQLLKSTFQSFQSSLLKITLIQYQQDFCFRKIKDLIELVNIAKVHFDAQIRKRQKEGMTEAKNYKFTATQFPNIQVMEDEGKFCKEEEIGKLLSAFRKINNLKNKKKSKKGEDKFLSCKIKITHHEIDQSWKAPRSSYGQLEKIKAEYQILKSYNHESADFLSMLSSDQLKKQGRTLIRKKKPSIVDCLSCKNSSNVECQCHLAIKSFETQIEIISFMRNIVNDSVAQYFLQDIKQEKNEVQNLYSKYYPYSLLEEDISGKELMEFLVGFLEGVQILNAFSVLHRDLKPSNVLLDRKRIPKIIDFGSAYELNGNISQYKINQKLVTTKKYNLFYSDAQFLNKKKMTIQEFQRHELFDMHAFGIILRDLYSSSSVSSDLGNLIVANLNWLSVKCSLHNPNLRINSDEALLFCSLLLKISNAKFSFYS